MQLAQTKEREYRFKLALRMGLPIFALVVALVSHTLIVNYTTLESSFYVQSILILVFSIYFILFLIYSGFDVKITDDVTKTFTREYLFNYLKKELKKKDDYSLILISVTNLSDINTQYGIKNGDKVLEKVSKWIVAYLQSQKIENFPLGHMKAGDFIIGLRGLKDEYTTILEFMCLKSNDFKVDDMEVKISGAISDSDYSRELDYIVENLFELQEETKNSKQRNKSEDYTPSEIESIVINAINKRSLTIMSQDVFEGDKMVFKECYVKLKTSTGKPLFPKTYSKVINKLGLGVDYDLMVLEKVVLHCFEEQTSVYAINIAPTSLRNENFLSLAKDLLRDSKCKVMFILSEQEYFTHTSRYNSIIHSLKSSGARIAIDRLGSIHSSFLYLRELDIDVVRMDTYYSSAMKMRSNRNIIEGFLVMAKEKNIKTWIKNLEDDEALGLAKEINVDYVQGKHLAGMEKFYEN